MCVILCGLHNVNTRVWDPTETRDGRGVVRKPRNPVANGRGVYLVTRLDADEPRDNVDESKITFFFFFFFEV